jgi:hypothetical protein
LKVKVETKQTIMGNRDGMDDRRTKKAMGKLVFISSESSG